ITRLRRNHFEFLQKLCSELQDRGKTFEGERLVMNYLYLMCEGFDLQDEFDQNDRLNIARELLANKLWVVDVYSWWCSMIWQDEITADYIKQHKEKVA
ncbi:MAG: hypothetical protein AAGM67_00770, partial [Bacteroidota bacterium]